MLHRFEVENYKNFNNRIVVDFSKVGGYQFNQECVSGEVLGKMLVYGRNATGKTNLGRALLDIAIGVGGRIRLSRGMFLNADAKRECADFKYVFQFDESELVYSYSKVSEHEMLQEELVVNGQRAFYYDFRTKQGQFDNLALLGADTVVVERYLDAMNNDEEESNVLRHSLPFLRWLINNTALQEGAVLLKLFHYVKRMSSLTVGTSMYGGRSNYQQALDIMYEDGLSDFEEFLNAMGVECKLDILPLPNGEKELYFVHETPVSFLESASSGTMVLLNLYIQLMMKKDASFLYFDEFDAFYHYEMSETVVKFFKKKYPNCQVIMTTHNTNLMTNRLMRPDCLFILSRDGRLTALCDATSRELREGHNLEKLYISGEFDKYE